MKYLRWIVTLPLAVAIVVFSVNNRVPAFVDPWPFGEALTIPLYILVLGAAAIGFLAGSVLQWLGNAPGRLQSRRKSGQINKLEAELGRLKDSQPSAEPRSGLPATTPPIDAV